MPNRRILVALIAAVVVALWAAFRPELLFVKKPVDEPFPTATAFLTTGAPSLVLRGTA